MPFPANLPFILSLVVEDCVVAALAADPKQEMPVVKRCRQRGPEGFKLSLERPQPRQHFARDVIVPDDFLLVAQSA